jgi:hypothetical protein
VKFVVNQIPATADKPHGLDYTMTLHGPDSGRVVGFDNAQRIAGQRGRAMKDDKHRQRTVKAYDYTDPAALLAAFRKEAESVMQEKGVWT